MDVVIHKEISFLEKIFPKWKKLKEEFQEITVFQDIGWIKSWWAYKSKRTQITPYIVEIRKRKKTIGIIPLYCSHLTFTGSIFRVLRPIGSTLSDYLIPILSKEYSAEKQLRKALEKIYEDKVSWDCIDWNDIPEYSIFDSVLNNHLKGEYNLIERKRAVICPFLILEKDVEEVKLKYDKKLVKEILTKKRKLKRNGELTYRIVIEEHKIEPIMNKFFEFHCERWEKTNTPSQFRFTEERDRLLLAAKNLFNSGLLHLSYLTSNDEIAAVEFAMADEKKIYLYLTAFNMKYKKFSVGNILLYNLIVEACRKGYEIVDFTRGDESYKQQWGTIDKFNVNYTIFNRTIKSLVLRSIYQTYYSEQFNQQYIGKQVVIKTIIRGITFILSIPSRLKLLLNGNKSIP